MGKVEPYKFCLTIKSTLKIVIFKNILSQEIVIINSAEGKRFKNTTKWSQELKEPQTL